VIETIGRRFARLVTNAVVRNPRLWVVFRPLLRRQFDSLAPRWDTILTPEHLAPYQAALDALPGPPRRALDLGTGTGAGALEIARRFPEAEVVGADLAPEMLAEATRKLPPEFVGRVRFERADASTLPYGDASFDLVALANMIPFFDELARVVEPGGHVLLAFSGGAETPIYVPFDRLRHELGDRGFAEFAAFAPGRGTALLARKRAGS
jgi:ubiquinone/menaquinone biosynthesis C-methylase UbiE